MYSSIKRSDEYKSCLLDFVRSEYGICGVSLTPAKRGFYGETWRLDAADSAGTSNRVSYFLKLVYADEHKDIYKRSFPVVRHLCEHGIDFISRVVVAEAGSLFTLFDGAVLGVFDWIDGELTESDVTKIPEYQMLARVYTVPADSLELPREDFSGASSDVFFERWRVLEDKPLLSLLEKNRDKITHRAERLKHFATLCQQDTGDFYITHGDAGGNLLVSSDEAQNRSLSYYIVDWDMALITPPERDAWVMCSKDWARDAFEDALRQNGISYTLRTERLAYYCYWFFFYYLTAFLDASADAEPVEEYIDGWIEDSIKYCERY